MAIQSMTGFARHEGEASGLRFVWELRSVNGKNLDVRLRLPQGFEALEQPIHAVDGVGAVCFDLPRVPLLDGTYTIAVVAMSRNGGEVYDRRDHVERFEVMAPGRARGTVALEPTVIHFFHDQPDPAQAGVDPTSTPAPS